MSDFGVDELDALTRLKKMREGGYFESEGSVPMPEIVADGEEPALADLLGSRRPVHEFDYRDTERRALQSYGAQTSLFCTKACQRMTQHGMVATYATGDPVFHCNICCACRLCCARLSGAQRLYEAVNDVGDTLAAGTEEQFDAVRAANDAKMAAAEVPDNPSFCTDCGAMLRCTVCTGMGPGGYCQTCGGKRAQRGKCPDCLEGA